MSDKYALNPESTADQEVLLKRAEILARSVRTDADAEEGFSVLVLGIGNEKYGVELEYIWEVVPYKKATPIPGGPHNIEGVINFRGQVVPLFSLFTVLTDEVSEKKPEGACIIFGKDQVDLAFAVDEVEPPIRVVASELQESISRPGDHAYSYVRGFTKGGVVVLNMGALLADESLIVNQNI